MVIILFKNSKKLLFTSADDYSVNEDWVNVIKGDDIIASIYREDGMMITKEEIEHREVV